MKLTITDSAARRVNTLLQRDLGADAVANIGLRVSVEGGGCSGFKYAFCFDSQLDEGDHSFDCGQSLIIVDTISAQYLDGATIDYIEELMGSYFTIVNPNAQTTCGCGSSFSVA